MEHKPASDSLHLFLTSTYDILLQSKEIKKNPAIKEKCQAAMEKVKGSAVMEKYQFIVSGGDSGQLFDQHLSVILTPLAHALFLTKQGNVLTSVMDSLQKIVSHPLMANDCVVEGVFNSETPQTPVVSSSSNAAEAIVQWICDSSKDITDEKMFVNVIKVLLAAVTSPNVLIHQASLLAVMKTVYSMFLLCRQQPNIVMLQGTINQMINAVLMRFSNAYSDNPELFQELQEMKQKSENSGAEFEGSNVALEKEKSEEKSDPKYPSPKENLPIIETNRSPSLSNEQGVQPSPNVAADAIMKEVLNNVLGDSLSISNLTSPSSDVAVNEEGQGKYGKCIVCSKAANFYCKDTMVPVCSKECKVLNLERFKAEQEKANEMQKKSEEIEEVKRKDDKKQKDLGKHMELLFRDAFIIIRSFCRLSSKPIVDYPLPPPPGQQWDLSKAPSVRTKLLALEQVHFILHNYGSMLMNFEIFVHLFRSSITPMIARCTLSPIPMISDVAFEIMLDYLLFFRSPFKPDNEILVNEVWFAVSEMKNATFEQKSKLLWCIKKLANDPALLVEIYLNYDCDPEAMDNMFEKLVGCATKFIQSRIDINASPSLLIEDGKLKQQAIECHVALLAAMDEWSKRKIEIVSQTDAPEEDEDESMQKIIRPDQVEELRHRKQLLQEGIRLFNYKIKKGMQFFLKSDCIRSNSPKDIAHFLLYTDGLNKKNIGEYLGEGEEENIAIMHAFVEFMDFNNQDFVTALRTFLQAFRLPGEAQKIDRFMLKFAQQYTLHNPGKFANADTAYVLAYSVIMLNTDLHNPQVKKRMKKEEFIKNNRGINDNADLPEQILSSIYDEILSNEIKMKEEEQATSNIDTKEFRSVKRNRDPSILAEDIAAKVEAELKQVQQRDILFHKATDAAYVRSMFTSCWMSFLAGLSGPLQESDDPNIYLLCFQGFKNAVHIACRYDMELERNAFLSSITKFATFNQEVSSKNLEAIKALLEIGHSQGDHLSTQWNDVIRCISQLEKFQLIASGALPQEPDTKGPKKNAKDVKRSLTPLQADRAAEESISQQMVIAVDKIFANSHRLSGTAIVHFTKALSSMSWEEISSTGNTKIPRMYSLQKLVEISYYNMNRIRLEWSQIWSLIAEHFNQVGCHKNQQVATFCVDSLRQLAVKFLEKEEMSQFKFQRDFLKPFEYILLNNHSSQIKDLVLRCLMVMIQGRGGKIKSGWKAMFNVFSHALNDSEEPIVVFCFDVMKMIAKDWLKDVVMNNSFQDYCDCLVVAARNKKFAKTSLHAVECLKSSIPKMAELSRLEAEKENKNVDKNEPVDASIELPNYKAYQNEDPSLRFWFPIHSGLHEIIMNCELEVRTRALNYLFDCLKQYGGTYSQRFWSVVCNEIIFPLFEDLKKERPGREGLSAEDWNEWMSTTLIQATRSLVDLFTVFFSVVSFLLSDILGLLVVCIKQENETLAKIGTSCLQQLIEHNFEKLEPQMWDLICGSFEDLFQATMPRDLLTLDQSCDVNTDIKLENAISASVIDQDDVLGVKSSASQDQISDKISVNQDRRKQFQHIVINCILQLLLVQTLQDILVNNKKVYTTMSSKHVVQCLDCLDKSYRFAKEFNLNMKLRMSLLQIGFTRQLPNLLKQETSSVICYLAIITQVYFDQEDQRIPIKKDVEKRFIGIMHDALNHYSQMDPEQKKRIITAWKPVLLMVLSMFKDMPDDKFKLYLPELYIDVVGLLAHDLPPEIRVEMQTIFKRVGSVYGVTLAK